MLDELDELDEFDVISFTKWELRSYRECDLNVLWFWLWCWFHMLDELDELDKFDVIRWTTATYYSITCDYHH